MAEQPGDEEAIFLAALEKATPQERNAFIEGACGGDLKLLERVRELLESHDESVGPLDSPAPGIDATIAQPITEKPGTQIGPYKLLQQIGEGGMGVVYMAEQTEPVERRVALKIIKPGMDTRQVIARFEAERHALALMDHPNIARVVDAGTTETGRPYFVMELVKGVPITQYCDEHHLTPQQRLELFVPVCHAVQHAHQKGVIHRDIKPTNILVAEYDDRPVPKIIDFGVAKAIQQRLTERTVFTQLGQVVGTIDYMSPEQAKLNELDVDTRSDVYSLGVLLYELLTGETPFDRERLRTAAFDELLRIIREEEPPKPSHRLSSSQSLASIAANRQVEPRKLSTLVRGDLDWIVMKALEKDRSRRYETANALAADVAHYLADEPVVACPPSAAYRFGKFARRNKGLLAATAIIAVILLLASFVSTSLAIRATRAFRSEMQAREEAEEAQGSAQRRADEATAARTEAERATAEAQAVADFLVNDLLGSAAPEKTLGRDLTVKEVLANAEKTIDTAFKDQPLRAAAVRHTMGVAYGSLGQTEACVRQLRWAIAVRTQLLGTEHPDTLRSVGALAWARWAQGDWKTARELLEETLAIQQRVLGDEHPDTQQSRYRLGIVLTQQGEPEEARKLFQEALPVCRRVFGPENPRTLSLIDGLADALAELGEWKEARNLYEEILVIDKRILGADHPRTLNAMHNLATMLRDLGEPGEACTLLQETVALKQRVLGPEHLYTLRSMNSLALALEDLGRSDESLKLHEKTLAIRQRILGPEHPDTLGSMGNLANALRHLGQLNEARKLYVETLDIQKRNLGPEHPDTLASMINVAGTLRAIGESAEARRIYEEVIPVFTRILGREHPHTLLSINNLALTLRDSGESDKAQRLLEETLATQRRVLGPGHRDTLCSLENLALVLQDLRKLDELHRRWQEFLRDLQQVAMNKPEDQPLQQRVASCEREICERYGAMGLWDLAATAARHNAARRRVTDRTRDADFAVLLAALGEEDAWREYCRLFMAQQEENPSGKPPSPQQIRTVLLLPPPMIDADECVALAKEILESDPQRYFYQFCLALTQFRASQYEEALKTIESNPVNASWESISGQGNKPACAYLYALAARGDERKEDALAQLARAEALYQQTCKSQFAEDRRELTEPFSRSFWDLGTAQVLRREAWQKIKAQSPPAGSWWHLIQARGFGLLGESERAEKEFAAAVAADDPEIWLVWATRARVREQCGDVARANADWSQALEHAPAELPDDDPLPWTERACLCARLGRYDEAARDFIRANELLRSPPRWDATSALFDSLMRHEEVFSRIAELRPDDLGLWAQRGDYYALRGQWERALPAYARASDLCNYGVHLAWVLLLTGDEEGYRGVCERMVDRFAQSGNPYEAFHLALACSAGPQSGSDPPRLVQWAELGLRLRRNKFTLQALARACYRAGQFDETVKLLQEAMGLPDAMPKSEAAFPLALAYRGLGQVEEARKWYQIGLTELKRITPRDASSPVSWAPGHWLIVNVMYHEAKAVFEPSEPQASKAEEPE